MLPKGFLHLGFNGDFYRLFSRVIDEYIFFCSLGASFRSWWELEKQSTTPLFSVSSGQDVLVTEMELSSRARKALFGLGITRLSEMVLLREENFIGGRNWKRCGEETIKEIRQKLANYGLLFRH